MRWKQLFLKNENKTMFISLLYIQKLKHKFSHFKSTPLFMFRLLHTGLAFKIQLQIYRCIFVHILEGIWPHWSLDTNGKLYGFSTTPLPVIT